MKRAVFFLLVFMLVPVLALAEDNGTAENGTTDNSFSYTINLGNGDGALLILGDGNQVYLPPEKDEVQQIQPNEITQVDDKFVLVLTETDMFLDGVRTRYTKMVLELTADGWDLLWFEQE